MSRKRIPTHYKTADEIPDADKNSDGYPIASKWAFRGFLASSHYVTKTDAARYEAIE